MNFKNISFQFCRTALAFGGGFTAVVQGARFDTCGLGVDATGAGQLGSVVIIDSTSINSGPVVKFRDTSRDSGPRNNQIVLENLSHAGNNPVAIAADGSVRLQRISPLDTWVWGNVDPGVFRTGQTLRLVINGTFEMGPLTCQQDSSICQFAIRREVLHQTAADLQRFYKRTGGQCQSCQRACVSSTAWFDPLENPI